ncbi:MAG: hypothetical protein V3W51_04695 [Candidatus Brocadiales bacterium]
MAALMSFLVWIGIQAFLLVLNFLFIFAWNHSLYELFDVVPKIGYWQGYLLLTVAGFILPWRVISGMKGSD